MIGKRTDSNHDEIRKAVQQLGGVWLDMTQARRSPVHCDAIVLYRGRVQFVEVKAPGGELTLDEREFHSKCGMAGVTVRILENIDDVLSLMEAI